MKFIKESAPHIRRKDSVSRMIVDVLIALAPTVIFALVVYGLAALRNLLISVAVMELCEFCYLLIKNKVPYDGKKRSLSDHWESQKKAISASTFLTPAVSGIIFALIMPVSANPSYMIYPILILGAAFGSILGKLIFGGTGKNIFNPAAIGMVFARTCFASKFAYSDSFYFPETATEITAGSTPLAYSGLSASMDLSHYSVLDLFLGRVPGALGEAFKIAILLGLVYLIVRHVIDWRIPLAFVATFTIDMLVTGLIVSASPLLGEASLNAFEYTGYQVLSGGLLFAAVFMATDPVTSPTTIPGRWIYGVFMGGVCAIIRLFASAPEGAIFAVLLGNIATCVIDYYRFSKPKFSWKNGLALGLTFAVPLLIIVWAVCVTSFEPKTTAMLLGGAF